VIDPDVLALIVALRERRLSFNAISEVLNSAGVPAPRGGTWWSGNVYRALKPHRADLCPLPAARPLAEVDAEEHQAEIRRRDAARQRERADAKRLEAMTYMTAPDV
jgi:hypothetical protein